MNKKDLLKNFTEDFKKSKGALEEVLDHNRMIDGLLIQDLSEGDFKKLEEHIEITRLIVDGDKSFNELYKNVPSVLESIDKLTDEDEILLTTQLEYFVGGAMCNSEYNTKSDDEFIVPKDWECFFKGEK